MCGPVASATWIASWLARGCMGAGGMPPACCVVAQVHGIRLNPRPWCQCSLHLAACVGCVCCVCCVCRWRALYALLGPCAMQHVTFQSCRGCCYCCILGRLPFWHVELMIEVYPWPRTGSVRRVGGWDGGAGAWPCTIQACSAMATVWMLLPV
jgi:hypothetical protein